MSRVIKSESGSRERDRLLKAIVKSIRTLMSRSEPGNDGQDIVAFTVLALYQVHESVDLSISAWEKRGYWLKADRYRMEWEWCEELGKELHTAVNDNEWDRIIPLLIRIGEKLNHIQLPKRDRIGAPWSGAREVLKEKPLPD